MKKICIVFFLLFVTFSRAQIQRVEYFFNTDPGYGNAIDAGIPVIIENEIALNFAASIENLSNGFHNLYIRAKDAKGWSQTLSRSFVKTTLLQDELFGVVYLEYFMDTDPGYHKGISINVDTTNGIYAVQADISSLSDGFHILYIRALNKNGNWSQVMSRSFVKTVLPTDLPADLVYVEYYIDSDPGKEKGDSVAFSHLSQTINFTADLSNIAEGDHVLKIRGHYANGEWKEIGTHPFTVEKDLGMVSISIPKTPIIIYPNPVTYGKLTVEDVSETVNIQQNKIEIYSLSGELVATYKATENKTELDVSHLSNGIYVVRINKYTIQFIKQ